MIDSRQLELAEPDIFDVLSATWVMACNDEQPIMTYEGICRRLSLSPSFGIRGLIHSRGDLFRQGLSEKRLATWKETMLAGEHVPTWIWQITNEAERRSTIEGISADDVFRCQFRREEGAPRASLEIIDWGLRHIDRLRNASCEARDTSAKSWQMWLVFAASLSGVAATIAAALVRK